jgi:glycosyltransferase involved in cell wall biosynthesis
MAHGVSVVIPVKDGARYLEEALDGLSGQELDEEIEVLVVDSGSRDNSVEIARRAGARVIEIPTEEFGHGKTRNLAAERTRGRCIAFLTQDATPAHPRWLSRLVAPLDATRRIGLSFGPHLPRPGTSPMIARELEEFFGSFSADRGTRVDDTPIDGDPGSSFFSNVNSCVLRECWEEVRFREIEYAEDQAFARDAMAEGWKKAYVPDAAVLHAHDYPFGQFMRRYFDEYRGLRVSTGHVENLSHRAVLSARGSVRKDLAYMRALGWNRPRRLAWAPRSLRHHLGRAVSSALGSRSDRLPKRLTHALSLEARNDRPARGSRRVLRARKPSKPRGAGYEYVREYHSGHRPSLAAPSPHDGKQEGLHIAWVIPPFRRGSGGHMTIFNLVLGLESRGNSCSIWVHDPAERMGPAAVIHREMVEHFAPVRAGVFRNFEDWHGADVVLATGWQTAYPVAGLPGCKLKSYLVQDYEPDFYPVSAQRTWAEETYTMGYPCITASPWLSDLMRERFGATAESFELGVDHQTYRALDVERDDRTVIFYSRPSTPRRATELGLLALGELAERQPDVRFVLFGDTQPPATSFDYDFAGIVDEQSLAVMYNRATVGLVLSLTNYSRIPKEMMACGLPVVDLAHPSVHSIFGPSGELIETVEPDPSKIADRLSELLAAPDRRKQQAASARRFVQPMTWDAAAGTVEQHLRRWLAERWSEAAITDAPRSSAPLGGRPPD